MSKSTHKKQKHTYTADVSGKVQAVAFDLSDDATTSAAPAVNPSLFARAKARVKTFFSRTPMSEAEIAKRKFEKEMRAAAKRVRGEGKGRSLWSRLWASVQRVTQAVVVKPTKSVGRFVARVARRVGSFFARVGRKVASVGRKVAKTRAFKVAHTLVRATLAFTLASAWVAAFLATPLLTVVYTVGAYFVLEVVAYCVAKLERWKDEGYRAADIVHTMLKVAAKVVYVGMQFAMAGLLVFAMVLNPALAVLELCCFAALIALDVKAEEPFQPRWEPGTCIACTNDKMINVAGLCRECKKMQVREDTQPAARDYIDYGYIKG